MHKVAGKPSWISATHHLLWPAAVHMCFCVRVIVCMCARACVCRCVCVCAHVGFSVMRTCVHACVFVWDKEELGAVCAFFIIKEQNKKTPARMQ